MTNLNKAAKETKTMKIVNNWDNRTLCGLDLVWVNDGRNSANYTSRAEATQVIDLYISINPEDKNRLSIEI